MKLHDRLEIGFAIVTCAGVGIAVGPGWALVIFGILGSLWAGGQRRAG